MQRKVKLFVDDNQLLPNQPIGKMHAAKILFAFAAVLGLTATTVVAAPATEVGTEGIVRPKLCWIQCANNCDDRCGSDRGCLDDCYDICDRICHDDPPMP
ncbi:hypothetical protein H9P43_007685 [Blastocladiella emersonii ATCC 22665]|nr:hypothetical protein H9P43_007685 [Blastocladiella emersonii ATCC 22665]